MESLLTLVPVGLVLAMLMVPAQQGVLELVLVELVVTLLDLQVVLGGMALMSLVVLLEVDMVLEVEVAPAK